MTLTDEELDALADRLWRTHYDFEGGEQEAWEETAREAARWAEEQQGEVAWEMRYSWSDMAPEWRPVSRENAAVYEEHGHPVRAIQVIATTTKEGV